MRQHKAVEDRVRRRLLSFLAKSDIHDVEVHLGTDLIRDTSLSSLQGLEFVLDLCDEFEFDFPADFNPMIDDEQRRGQTFGGLVNAINRYLGGEGGSNVKK